MASPSVSVTLVPSQILQSPATTIPTKRPQKASPSQSPTRTPLTTTSPIISESPMMVPNGIGTSSPSQSPQKVLTAVPSKELQKNQTTSLPTVNSSTRLPTTKTPSKIPIDGPTSGVVPVPTLEPVDQTPTGKRTNQQLHLSAAISQIRKQALCQVDSHRQRLTPFQLYNLSPHQCSLLLSIHRPNCRYRKSPNALLSIQPASLAEYHQILRLHDQVQDRSTDRTLFYPERAL